MSDMRHHAVFRHREFASFLRMRRHFPSSHPLRRALPHPPLPLPTIPAPRPAQAPAFAKTSSLASARKRPRDDQLPRPLPADPPPAKAPRKHEPVVFNPVTSPTAVANVLTPTSLGFQHTHDFDHSSTFRTPESAPAEHFHQPLQPLAPRSASESEEPDDSQLTPGFDCELCNTRFYRKHHLERHIQNIHEGQRPWTCELCGFAFHQKPNLERHIMTVHEEQRPFRCNVCEMSFGRKGVLKKHVQMVHEHSRKFECETCKISFGLKSDLKRHVQSVHQRKRPFACEVCSASFGRKSDLKRHILSLHPGAEVPSKRNSGPSSGPDTS